MKMLTRLWNRYCLLVGYKRRPCPFHEGLRIRSTTFPQASTPSFPKDNPTNPTNHNQ